MSIARLLSQHTGALLAHCGRSVKDESPSLMFPNGFDPRVRSSTRIAPSRTICSLCAIRSTRSQRMNMASRTSSYFLTENVLALQPEQLAALMGERKCKNSEMFLARESGLLFWRPR